ncbi:hypothetical protein [uncultured Fibrobacter sp.]|uniref:hypothetical protein n=1 Tax=uncultured Fibrobacter sp. TaxID=261512 RepID=UPI0025F75695|nr:hypothetical protein [uncultured Fibrobacter sp.]
MGRKPRINSFIYTYGKFGKGFREILDTENKFLYSHGHYPTKIVAEDLPEDYIKIRSRTLWYMTGFLKTSGVVDIQYKMAKLNHLFKDDYIFISYKEKLKVEEDRFGFIDYVNDDACFCGPDILDIAHAVEKYSLLDISHIRKGMKEKVRWLKKNEPDFYETCFQGNDKDFLKKIDSKW